jgi:hypothetical protein
MPGAFKSTCIQGVANAVPYLMTHIGQVYNRKVHEAKGRVEVIWRYLLPSKTQYIQSII